MKYLKYFENIILESSGEDFFTAVRQLSKNMVTDLLRKGYNINTKNKIGFTPLIKLLSDSAFTKDKVDFLKFLISKGADVNAKDHFGQSALVRAFLHDNLKAVDILISAGADWTISDQENDDFIDYLGQNELKKLKEKFPIQFEEAMMKKDAKKYNL